MKNKLLEAFWVCISAQIIILPIIAYFFNTISLTFLVSNLIAVFIFPVIMFGGIILIFSSFFFPLLADIIKIPVNIALVIFKNLALFFSNLPFTNIIVPTPKIMLIILYYFTICLILVLLNNNWIRKKFRNSKFKNLLIFVYLLILISVTIMPNENCLKIHFVDVGQGDCTLIVAPNGKNMLIDGGGSENLEEYDVGKKVLVPYLLDRGIKNIDYIMVSHFHADHCNGLLSVIEKLNIKCVLFGNQEKSCKEYENFISVVKRNNVRVKILNEGDSIQLSNTVRIDIISTGISSNNLNNTSIIAKLFFNNFSMLFTGDAEYEEEVEILKKANIKSTVLKVGHHRF